MTSYFDFDEIFRDFGEIMKRIRGFEEIEKELKSGKLKGGWDVKRIDEPNVKGYVIQGRFGPDQPLEPFDPFKPNNPFERRPMPQRSFRPSEIASTETREPLTDVFEEDKTVKIYVELPGEEKADIQLNVIKGKVEIKTKNFVGIMKVFSANKALIVTEAKLVNLEKSSKNVPWVKVMRYQGLNVYDILKYDYLFLEQPAIGKIEEALAS